MKPQLERTRSLTEASLHTLVASFHALQYSFWGRIWKEDEDDRANLAAIVQQNYLQLDNSSFIFW